MTENTRHSAAPALPTPGQERFRFAPSPNGRLHLGHAYSALLNRRMADACSGTMLVRIEDLDRARCTPALEDAAIEDLAALGVRSDGPILRQSERGEAYRRALEELKKLGLVYPAFLSRGAVAKHVKAHEATGAVWPRDPDGAALYPPEDRSLSSLEAKRRIEDGEPHAWRLRMTDALKSMPESALHWWESGPTDGCEWLDRAAPLRLLKAQPSAWGDVVVYRTDSSAAYHLAVVVDDAEQAVTRCVRGADLFAATAVHRVLQTLLGLAAPTYHHHALVRDERGRKLAKSAGDGGLSAYLGMLGSLPPGTLRNRLDTGTCS